MENMYDLIIVGGGPAGCAASVYAARKRLKTLLILKDWGGQSIVSDDIQNWIGTPHISGNDLAISLKNHVLEYKSDVLEIVEGATVQNTIHTDENVSVVCDNGNTYLAKTLLVATGSVRKKLQIIGSDMYEHKGITYCASCDGPMFGGTDVVVVGGGNAALESAAQLLSYCSSVTLMIRGEEFRADEITVQKVTSHPNLHVIKNAVPKEVKGETFVTSLIYTDTQTGNDIEIPTSGIFVEIGQIPATSFLAGSVELTPSMNVKTDPRTQRTSAKRIWAAGDCTDVLYHQNNIAAGDAVKALEDIYVFIHAS